MNHKSIIKRLCDHGYQAFIVGGTVRDILGGFPSDDVDIATNATPEQVLPLFSNCKAQKVGNRFAVVFIGDIQVATYRKDTQVKLYSRKDTEIAYSDSIQEDMLRRDLTINALAMCPVSGDIIDVVGGKKDLQNRIIRFVGDPTARIMQDPTRIVRACRFLAKIQGQFSGKTLQALQKYANLAKNHIEKEMLRLEFLKAMKLETPSLFFSALHLTGVLRYIFPELHATFNYPHGAHHIESVWEHLMLTGDHLAPKDPILRLAGFLHDIGKPPAHKYHNDGSFIGHEVIGSKICQHRLPLLGFTNRETKEISRLVESHMRQCRSLSPKGQRKLRKYLYDNEINPRSYLRLKIADRKSNLLRGATEIRPLRELLISVGLRGLKEDKILSVKDLKLSGGKIIEMFKLTPGPIVGKIQRHLLDLVIDDPALNTEENLYKSIKEYIENVT